MTVQEFTDNEYARDVIGYEGYYKISNTGKVWSIKTNKYLKNFDTSGYHSVHLYKNGTKHKKYVLNLVMEAFTDIKWDSDTLTNIKHTNTVRKNGKPRGAYPFPLGKKQFRSMIRTKGKLVTLGYTTTKEEAYALFYMAFTLAKGYTPWTLE